MKGITVTITGMLAIFGFSLCLILAGCGEKEKSKKLTNADFDAKQTAQNKTDPAEEANKHLEAILQYYHSVEKPQNTPVKVCFDSTSKIYFIKFATDVGYSYKDDDGNMQQVFNHYAGWNSINEKDLTFVTIGNGSLAVTNGPDTSKNISANLDGLPCMNFSQVTKVWDNQ